MLGVTAGGGGGARAPVPPRLNPPLIFPYLNIGDETFGKGHDTP